jgi:uncharacterized protein YkwD
MTALINAQRVASGLKKVSTNATLRKAGRAQSMGMARGARFAHSTPLAWANGRAAAQNIAYAPSTTDAFQAMMASPEHRANLMGAAWRQTGVGVARNCEGTLYFTVNLLAAPPD